MEVDVLPRRNIPGALEREASEEAEQHHRERADPAFARVVQVNAPEESG